MPCYEGPRPEELRERKIPAVMCGLMRTGLLTSEILNQVDWKETGVTPEEFMQWWEEHQERDAYNKKVLGRLHHHRE